MVTAEWAFSISECAGWAKSFSPPSEFIMDDEDFRMNLLLLTALAVVTGFGCKNSELSSVSIRGVAGALTDVCLALVRKFQRSSRFPVSDFRLRVVVDVSLMGCRSDAVDERCSRTASFTVRWLAPEPPEASLPLTSDEYSVEEICNTGRSVLHRVFLTLDKPNMIRPFFSPLYCYAPNWNQRCSQRFMRKRSSSATRLLLPATDHQLSLCCTATRTMPSFHSTIKGLIKSAKSYSIFPFSCCFLLAVFVHILSPYLSLSLTLSFSLSYIASSHPSSFFYSPVPSYFPTINLNC